MHVFQEQQGQVMAAQEVGKAMLHQAVRSILMGLCFVLGMWLMGHRMPWQSEVPPLEPPKEPTPASHQEL